MFTKAEAIEYIKGIQSGKFDRYEVALPLGVVAADLWHDDLFSYGMEYGAILGLMVAFDLTIHDLGLPKDHLMRRPNIGVPSIYHDDRCSHR